MLVTLVLIVSGGCGDDGMPLGPPPADSGWPSSDDAEVEPIDSDLPCDVADIISARCSSCHGETPLFGAPMSLTRAEHFHLPARSDASLTVGELVLERTHDAAAPMPPTGLLEPLELSVIDDWLGAGGLPGSCEVTTEPPPPITTGPEALPCEPTHTLTAHADGSEEGFAVPVDAGNLYECFTFKSPFADGSQATAFAPIIDDERVIHHWILYKTEQPQVDGGVMGCNMPLDSSFVAGWAPGGQNTVMPDDVGLELPGPDDYLILQVHYWNVARHADAVDASGVAFCTTDEPRTHEAGMLTLGDVTLSIPPRSVGHVETGTCRSSITRLLPEPLNVIGSFPHMHEFGSAFSTHILRGGSEADREALVEIDRWDFQDQRFHPNERSLQINPGDALETRCIYDNPTSDTIRFGERTEDEMCLNFLMVYPIGAVGNYRTCGLW